MNHIDEARSKLNSCQCGCTFINMMTWFTDNKLKQGEMYVSCGYCHKRTKICVNPFDAQMDWNSGRVYDAHIKIVSEKEMVENCISLISNYIEEYNDIMQLEGEYRIPLPQVSIWEIVRDLLLQGTTHADMITSIQKTRELGFEWGKTAFVNEEK